MKNPGKFAVLDIGLHLVVVLWFLILLRKARAGGIELTSMEFGVPVFVVSALVLIVIGIQFLVGHKRS